MIVTLQVVPQAVDFNKVLIGESKGNLLSISTLGLIHFDAFILLLVDESSSLHQHFRSFPTDILDEHLQLDVFVLQVNIVNLEFIDLLSNDPHAAVQLADLPSLEPEVVDKVIDELLFLFELLALVCINLREVVQQPLVHTMQVLLFSEVLLLVVTKLLHQGCYHFPHQFTKQLPH
jgi:hypothetical protein